jgi:hypothetical protein
MQHPTFSATLAEQHRHELRRQAYQARRLPSTYPASRSRWRAAALHWWQPATRTASA